MKRLPCSIPSSKIWTRYRTADKGERRFILFSILWADKKFRAVMITLVAAIGTAVAAQIGLPTQIWGKPNESAFRQLLDKGTKALLKSIKGEPPATPPPAPQ